MRFKCAQPLKTDLLTVIVLSSSLFHNYNKSIGLSGVKLQNGHNCFTSLSRVIFSQLTAILAVTNYFATCTKVKGFIDANWIKKKRKKSNVFCSHFCKTNLSIGIEELTADGSFKISQLITYNKNKWNTYDRSRRRFCIVLVLVFNVLYIDIMLSVQQSNNSLVDDFSDCLSRYEWIPVTISSSFFFRYLFPFAIWYLYFL